MDILFDDRTRWIKAPDDFGTAVPLFERSFDCNRPFVSAVLHVTAHGVYRARINGASVGDFVFAPGWTSHSKRLQVQIYDVTALLSSRNRIEVSVGEGWLFMHYRRKPGNGCPHIRLLAALDIVYADGSSCVIPTDSSWTVRECEIRCSNFYMGETIDDAFSPPPPVAAVEADADKSILIPQEGEKIVEAMTLPPLGLIETPKGETVLDFGQNITGYVDFHANGPEGAELILHHAEVLDANGDFYAENYRSATSEVKYVCGSHPRRVRPTHSFQGFRFVRLRGFEKIRLEDFMAVVVSSDMRRTGCFSCSDAMLDRLFDNIVWGQRGNFLDVPTDCPQRDERLGWTGDAQVFAEVATLNFDTRRFFGKWLADMTADQLENGLIPQVIPSMGCSDTSAGWGDAATIIPWQMYLTYGDSSVLRRQFPTMKKWVDYITAMSTDGLWDKSPKHFGDWLGLDAGPGGYKGATDEVLIATAYYAHSTEILIKSGTVLGMEMGDYRRRLHQIRGAFREKYIREGRMLCETQTACVLALFFGLCKEEHKTSITGQLVELIRRRGHLCTGFIGTPYLLHALSRNGETELAYELLLRREYPGWLYPITKGATTMWEHWDGIRPDGSMWSADMNSFNHYAYGSVGDWLYGVVCGIRRDEERPGFENIFFEPQPSRRLQWAKGVIDSVRGRVISQWERKDGGISYTFTVPADCHAVALINGVRTTLHEGGQTIFSGES